MKNAWKLEINHLLCLENSMNASIGGVGLLLNSRAYKSLLNIEKYNQE